jgi:hypothetical protein
MLRPYVLDIIGLNEGAEGKVLPVLHLIMVYYVVEHKSRKIQIPPFHRTFQFTKYNGPTNALVYNKTLI